MTPQLIYVNGYIKFISVETGDTLPELYERLASQWEHQQQSPLVLLFFATHNDNETDR